jgi:tetratricopeptide (TPR) repeat protein
MLPTVFLSLAGVDAKYVSRVHEHLPDGLAYFYLKSFENGENLISAMEERIGQSSVFVLFASHASIESWAVQFEIARARLAKLKKPDFRILVFPLGADVTYSALPSWMQEAWIARAGYNPRDIARYIRNVLSSVALSPSRLRSPYGRGAFLDVAIRELQEAVLTLKQTPNIFIFGGNNGIGRRTVASAFLEHAFPTKPELTFGPEFQLPQFADIDDLYRSLRQEIEPQFSLQQFQKDLAHFNNLPIEERATEISRNLAHFGELSQGVTIVTGNGIYEERGVLKPWVPLLFRALSSNRAVALTIITNRLLHENEIRPHANALQFSVPALQDEDIRALMIATAPAFDAEPQLPNNDVIKAIGGHPSIAKAATRLIAQKGATVLNNDLRSLYNVQEEVLSESLDFENLSEMEKDVLSVLSWVPQLSGQMLEAVIKGHRLASNEEFADTLSNLILACLVQISGPNYLISSPIRGMFRRKHGYGSTELRSQFSAALRAAWQVAKRDDELKAELFDALVYMTALEGGSLPAEFSGLLLPSTLQEIVRDTYDRGHDDEGALRRVVAWGGPSFAMKMDETVREEILSYVVRAQTRLSDVPGAEETLRFIDSRNYRSRYYLRSFFVRYTSGDLKEAVTLLCKARDARKYMGRVASDLALCYFKLGMWPQLNDLLKEEERYIGKNASLLDIKIGTLIAKRDYGQAEIAIRNMRALPFEDGRADSRTAIILMKRDHDYRTAQRLLDRLLIQKTGGHVAVRRLRAIAAASGGDFETARQDANFLKGRAGGRDMALRIEARIKLVQNDYEGALKELDNLSARSAQDELLEARILEAKVSDVATPIAEREKLRGEIVKIRIEYGSVDEFEINF